MHRPGRAVAIVAAAVCVGLTAVTAAFAASDGDLDHGFDGDGKLITDFGGTSAPSVLDSAVDANGKLVVVGGSADIEVARFNPDGTPDAAFGGDGFVTVDSGTTSGGERARAVAIQSDGKIVIAGDANIAASGNTIDSVFARLNSDGTLDNTFDGPGGSGNGVFRLNTGNSESVNDVVVNGTKIDFGGSRNSPLAPLIGQLNLSNGTVDTGFGSAGFVSGLNFPGGSGSFITSLAVQSDGQLIAAGAPNGATGYGVARITTSGALDTTVFNPPNGYLVAPLPSGYIDAAATDVLVDSGGGIVVVGLIESGGPDFDNDPFISRVTTVGAVDTNFGTNGYTIVPAGADPSDSVGFQAVAAMADGHLVAAGNDQVSFDPGSPYQDQLVARFTSGGALDSTFADLGTLDSDLGASAVANSISLSSTGTAYAVGQAAGSLIAITAVCANAATACPAPDMPVVQSVTPASGANDNAPRVRGDVSGVEAPTAVDIFTTVDCSGAPAASGTEAQFEGSGIPVSVADNSTTTFHALARGVHADSACSATSVTYSEVTPSPPAPPAAGPTGQRAAALKKCAKVKNKIKKRKCKTRARALPV
jgi:uncharacterized delta-60 repeat protein